jgi:hypothetical protein
MKPTTTRGATNLYHAPENWDPETMGGECGDLEVRVETYGTAKNNECISTWKPSAEELLMLNAGGVVEIGLSVANQPVMRAYVVPPTMPPKPFARPIVINEHAHGDDSHVPELSEADKDWQAECDRG